MRRLFYWSSILLSTVFSCFWAFWGIIENFHEGWYYESIWMNIGLMLSQYLLFTIIITAFGVITIKWKKIGATLFIVSGILIPLLKIRTNAAIFIFALPLVLIGILFLAGNIQNKKLAYRIIVLVPLITILIFGFESVYRVSQRIDDRDYGMRIVEGNNIQLTWAPEGPGWPATTKDLERRNWNDITELVSRLRADGKSLSDTSVNIWRLPTIEESVASLTRNGKNCGGVWNQITGEASYQVKPDKESPLWKVHSPIIYWWTSSEVNDSTVYRIVYNGSVQKLNKKISMGSLGFRAVK